MEPGLRDREYGRSAAARVERGSAAMEPGLRDREYLLGHLALIARQYTLQWSPVLETGNTPPISAGWRRGTPGCNGAQS